MSKNRFHLETGEFGDDSSATRPREGTAISTTNKSRKSRRRIYDLDTFTENNQLVVALKQRVKAMDERKSQLEAYLRSARTSQWVSKQEADQLTNEFREHLSHIITTDSCRKLHSKITESEATLKSLYQEVHDVRDMAVDLAKTCDMQREAIQSSQVELDVLKSRFLRALPHVSGEVFLREPTSAENRPKQITPLPPRIKPQPLPLPPPPDFSLVSKFSLEIGACALGRVFRKIILRRTLKKFAPVSPLFQMFAEAEISRFRRFIAGSDFPDLLTLPGIINARDLLEIVTQTGYPTPGAVIAALARGGVGVNRKYLVNCIWA